MIQIVCNRSKISLTFWLSLCSPNARNVERQFEGSSPSVAFTVDGTNYVLSLNNHSAFLTSNFLRACCLADPRVKALGVCLRLWAKTCRLDRHVDGSLSPYAFSLMLVSYLQQVHHPVLGVLGKECFDESHQREEETHFRVFSP